MKLENPIKYFKTIDIDSLIPSQKSAPSSRMGASSIAKKCERAIWLDFHWAIDKDIKPKSQRIFHLGNILEDEMQSYLESQLGIKIDYAGKEQIKVEIAPHFVCMPDGIIFEGVPTAEKTIHTWENKSCNKETYNKFLKEGVAVAKPEYYTQMQCEMYAASIYLEKKVERALFTAYCKDNSEIYAERIDFDEECLQYHLDKAERIRTSDTLPEKISADPTFFVCKMCEYSHFCHFTHEIKNINCRTCTHSTPKEDGSWSCALDKKFNWGMNAIDYDLQKSGCDYHAFNPSLMTHFNHLPELSTETSVAFEMPESGEIYVNGLDGITSEELLKVSIPKGTEDSEEVTF